MQYLLMCCADEAHWEKLPEAERESIMGEYGKLIHELKTSGRLLAGAKLDRTASAVTVREKNGKPCITDGPFAETREQIGGYHLIECKDRDEAVSIALRIPTLAVGGLIEVRPLIFAELCRAALSRWQKRATLAKSRSMPSRAFTPWLRPARMAAVSLH
jgi:hypothetical protein